MLMLTYIAILWHAGIMHTCTFIAAPTTNPTLWATNEINKHAEMNMPNLNGSAGCEVR